jgi:hypothetical protein
MNFSAARAGDTDWREEVTQAPLGKFAPLPDLRMHFVFGWSNVLQAAEADATIKSLPGGYRAMVTGKTEGLARTLWPLDAQHSVSMTITPKKSGRVSQVERYRSRTIETLLRFDANGVDRRRVASSKDESKWKRVNFSPLYDMVGGILYIRSQPLRIGDKIGVVSFPGDSPYLTVVTVEKRETIRCMGRDRPALRLSLDVRKLEVAKKAPTTAVPYTKFRSGTVWVSDDALRIPIRAEMRIFVGFVYGEIKSCEQL